MNPWIAKRQYIWNLAYLLTGSTMAIPRLAGFLNAASFQTDNGLHYQGLRGTYALVSSTWKWLDDQGLSEEAENVAQVFVKPDGKHAWE